MSATDMQPGGLCAEVEEQLAQVLDGTAPAVLYDHIADCDACRDLRHDAAAASEAVAGAGADFRPAADFADALLARLDAARPAQGGGAGSSGAVARTVPGEEPEPVEARVEASGAATFETARTELASLALTERAAEQAVEHAAPPGVEHVSPPFTTPVRTDPQAGVAASAHTGEALSEARRATRPAQAAPRAATVSPLRRRALFAGAIGAVAAAAAVGFLVKGRVAPPEILASGSPWSGTIASVARASADKAGGLEACDASGACSPIAAGAPLPKGTTLRTDARTRAYLALDDGTQLALDRGSRVWIGAGKERAARVEAGTVVVDVAKLDGAPAARIKVPHGEIEVLGTKLAITASDERASIEVARGVVRVTGERGDPIEVRAGEEATIARGGAPEVASTTSLADVMEWSDRSSEEVDAPVLRGLGELRARKPGSTQEKEKAVRLAKHAVKVRIVDLVARTEVDETFSNDTDEELEGIFRFPLPPGAQIERLALEVDGKLVEGAFVDRDRGAAIWRGVIQNAAPKAPKPREEIIWVPGPWRDPALLEWQRGGRFELRIFPIPKRGSRRVVLTYTQLVEQSGGVRRFTYPLAHDDSGTTRIGDFSLDLQVLGHDRGFGVTTRGYDLAPAAGGDAADRRTLQAQGFTPAGDLTVEYALPDRDREVTAWAYKATPAAPPEPALAGDTSPYVAVAIRPRLPRWQEAKARRHVVVVDSSRSMFGERFARARRLAASIVREMDRRDEVVVLACDTLCRAFGGDGAADSGAAPRPMAPGAAAASDVERFLGGIEPDGGSDLAAAMIAAHAAAGAAGKELRIIYLGDGTPSVGPTRAAHLEAAVRGAIPSGDAAVVAVALGSDADTTSLQALARGGGGVMIPYVPGQKVATAAQSVLGAAYGVMLRDPELELPAGLTQVTPARLDPIRAGGETIVVARMSSGAEVAGAIHLRGRIGGERFEQSYPVSVVASTSAGNAFVPRLYAAAKIAELERLGGDAQKPAAIELSKRFSVASRFTSLLVLESEAMFKAFGLDRSGVAPTFTGEQQADSVSADADGDPDADADAAGIADELGRLGMSTLGGASAGAAKKDQSRATSRAPAKPADVMADKMEMEEESPARGRGGFAPPPPAAAAPRTPTAGPMPSVAAEPKARVARRCAPDDPLCEDDLSRRDGFWRSQPRRMIPMRRVFDRGVSFDATNTIAPQNAAKTLAAETSLAQTPDSRDRTAALYALYATTGRLGEAQELTARWSGRDALDPDAIVARADLAAREGDRDRAVRILGGLADVRPGDKAIQTRLAALHDAATRPAFACQHRLALADLAPAEAKLVAAAIRCARAQGMDDLASALRFDAADATRAAIDQQLAALVPPAAQGLRGDVQLSAEWTGGVDLDLALIDDQGRRVSWLGSPVKAATVSARDVTSGRAEALAVLNLPKGSYVVEVARASTLEGDRRSPSGGAGDVVRGDLTLRIGGETRRLPFTLTGARLELGTVRVFFTSRLVPIDGASPGLPTWRPR